MKYVPLRVHSDYSLLDAIIKPKQIIDIAIEQEFPSIALTDTNNLFAAAEYSFYAKQKQFPAMLGCTLETELGKIVLYCKTEQGYHKLCNIMHDFYLVYKGKYPIKALGGMSEGLLLLIGGADGILSSYTEESFNFLHNEFGSDLVLELNRTEGKHHTENLIATLSNQYNIPVVGTSVAKYMKNHLAYQVSKAVKTGEVLTFDNKEESEDYKLLSNEEFSELFSDCPQVVENTNYFAQRCSFLIPETKPTFAFFADNAEELLLKWANNGLEYLLSKPNWLKSIEGIYENEEIARKAYYDRLNYELDMIMKLGFTDYFLIVADFVKWARDQKISLSARGSGAGSLVAWCLFITTIDPMVFGLFFERFINPGRVSLPDFDIDFCQERRLEVVEYVEKKYGKELIAHIITFGAWHARGVLRDVGRVLGMSYGFIDRLSKRIPNNPNMTVTLKDAIEDDPELSKLYKEDADVERLFNISLDLEGLHRNVSLHAAGVIIGYKPLKDIIPLYATPEMPLPATQYVMSYIERVGLVKFDFLGLTALTIIDKILVYLEKDGIVFDINHLDYTEDKVYKLLCKGLTAGVFQFESVGLTNVIARLQPTKFEELIAIISLYRPGPLENIGEFIARKHGLSDITYDYDILQDILAETYGIIVYQEQVINIARVLAGYTLSEADLLRRAMGKKIAKEMEQQRDIFVSKVLEHYGGEKEKATELFDKILKFSGYAFNKAHAASHAFIGYQTAFLKAYYPLQFMAVSLTLEKQRHDKIANLARELPLLSLELVKPDINTGCNLFSFTKPDKILYCLSAIKSIGEAFVGDLERKRGSGFANVEEFCMVMKPAKGVFDALLFSGAFDELPIYDGENTSDVYDHRNRIYYKKDALMNLMGRGLFDDDTFEHTQSIEKLLINEWKYTGVVFSNDLLKKKFVKKSGFLRSGQLLDFSAQNDRATFNIQALLLDKQLIKTKQGRSQWVFKMADQDSVFEVFVKTEIYDKIQVEVGQVLFVKAKLTKTYCIADSLSIAGEEKTSSLLVKIDTDKQLEMVHNVLKATEKGAVPVILNVEGKELAVGKYDVNTNTLDSLDLGGMQYRWRK